MTVSCFTRAGWKHWTRFCVFITICFFCLCTRSRGALLVSPNGYRTSTLLQSLNLPLHTEYEIVAPYEVSQEGAYISHRVSHHERRRRRRSLTPEEQLSNKGRKNEKVHFRLSGLGQDFHMELWEASESLIAPGFTIQVLGKNSTKSLRAYHQDDLCFYQGSLRSRVNSSVALSTCMGMVSLNMHSVRLQKELDEIEGLND